MGDIAESNCVHFISPLHDCTFSTSSILNPASRNSCWWNTFVFGPWAVCTTVLRKHRAAAYMRREGGRGEQGFDQGPLPRIYV